MAQPVPHTGTASRAGRVGRGPGCRVPPTRQAVRCLGHRAGGPRFDRGCGREGEPDPAFPQRWLAQRLNRHRHRSGHPRQRVAPVARLWSARHRIRAQVRDRIGGPTALGRVAAWGGPAGSSAKPEAASGARAARRGSRRRMARHESASKRRDHATRSRPARPGQRRDDRVGLCGFRTVWANGVGRDRQSDW